MVILLDSGNKRGPDLGNMDLGLSSFLVASLSTELTS